MVDPMGPIPQQRRFSMTTQRARSTNIIDTFQLPVNLKGSIYSMQVFIKWILYEGEMDYPA
eukprot:10339599-Prorocentrum_lima.AAC.1